MDTLPSPRRPLITPSLANNLRYHLIVDVLSVYLERYQWSRFLQSIHGMTPLNNALHYNNNRTINARDTNYFYHLRTLVVLRVHVTLNSFLYCKV